MFKLKLVLVVVVFCCCCCCCTVWFNLKPTLAGSSTSTTTSNSNRSAGPASGGHAGATASGSVLLHEPQMYLNVKGVRWQKTSIIYGRTLTSIIYGRTLIYVSLQGIRVGLISFCRLRSRSRVPAASPLLLALTICPEAVDSRFKLYASDGAASVTCANDLCCPMKPPATATSWFTAGTGIWFNSVIFNVTVRVGDLNEQLGFVDLHRRHRETVTSAIDPTKPRHTMAAVYGRGLVTKRKKR